MEDYNSLWPKWGLELGVMLKYFGDHGEDSWGAKTSIGKNELGIKDDELVSFKDALTKFDWGLA